MVRTTLLVALLTVAGALPGAAAPGPQQGRSEQGTQEQEAGGVTPELLEMSRQRAQHGQRVELRDPPILDPVIFTGISPYATAREAVRLPAAQRLD